MHKNAGTQDPEKGSPTNFRCKAPHLIKIILAYSPKKKRADPIEDESEVQQGHFCPPPFSRSRTWTLPLIQLPASKQLAFPLQGMEVWRNRHQNRGIFTLSHFHVKADKKSRLHPIVMSSLLNLLFLSCYCFCLPTI